MLCAVCSLHCLTKPFIYKARESRLDFNKHPFVCVYLDGWIYCCLPCLGTTTASPLLRAALSRSRHKTRWDWGWTTAPTVRSNTATTDITWIYQYPNSVSLFDSGFLYVDAMIKIVSLSMYSRSGQSQGLLYKHCHS